MGSTTCCPVAVCLPRPRMTTLMMKERAMTNKEVVQVSLLTSPVIPVVVVRVFVLMSTVALMKEPGPQGSRSLTGTTDGAEEEEDRSRLPGSSRGPSRE